VETDQVKTSLHYEGKNTEITIEEKREERQQKSEFALI